MKESRPTTADAAALAILKRAEHIRHDRWNFAKRCNPHRGSCLSTRTQGRRLTPATLARDRLCRPVPWARFHPLCVCHRSVRPGSAVSSLRHGAPILVVLAGHRHRCRGPAGLPSC